MRLSEVDEAGNMIRDNERARNGEMHPAVVRALLLARTGDACLPSDADRDAEAWGWKVGLGLMIGFSVFTMIVIILSEVG